MKTIVNLLGVGGFKPLVTPLLDSATWLDLPVLTGAYTHVNYAFEHNGGVNDEQGDQSSYFLNDDALTYLETSAQELSDTFLVPRSLWNNNSQVVEDALQNLAKIFLEAHLLMGGQPVTTFKDSPIKGVLINAKEIDVKDADDLALAGRYELPNTGKQIIQFNPSKLPAGDLKAEKLNMDILPYGKMMKDLDVMMNQTSPEHFVASEGSMVLIGSKTPTIATKFLPDKNMVEVAIAWFVGGVPASDTVALKGKVTT